MKAYADFSEAISAAKQAQEMLDALDQALYTLDGEIPNDDADRRIKDTRRHLYEAGKSLGYVASGMWTVPDPIQGPAEGPDDAPNPWDPDTAA
jgi:hypothetical protein